MSNYQCAKKQEKYFEGWYFKHQKDDQYVILIPGICAKPIPKIQIMSDLFLRFLHRASEYNIRSEPESNDYGQKYAFIQIITNENSYCVYYPMSECKIARDKIYIKIGDNIFSNKGIKLNIISKDICLKGVVKYGSLSPIRYPIMGIFQYVPRMECNHEIISMSHKLHGNIIKNGVNISFDNGIGYMEKDWGHSFPKSYLWVQCNNFPEDKCAVSLSIAEIPLYKIGFTGCIGIVQYRKMEYRFATYLGVRIITYNNKEIQLRQGKYLLRIQFGSKGRPETGQTTQTSNSSCRLLAPDSGMMVRTIDEQNSCLIQCELFEGSRLIFNLTSDKASLEIVN